MKWFNIAALVLVAFVFPCSAYAKGWVVDYNHSRLGFTGKQGDSAFEGSFKNFKTDIDFDPDKPETGKIAATIDTGSATAGSSDRDSLLPQADWFNTGKFPQAQFTSTGIHKTGDNTFVADGNLTIKGVSHQISLPFTLTKIGDSTRAQGRLSFLRTDFGIGQGQWANESYVKYAVDVVIDITAKPQS